MKGRWSRGIQSNFSGSIENEDRAKSSRRISNISKIRSKPSTSIFSLNILIKLSKELNIGRFVLDENLFPKRSGSENFT